MKGTRLIAAILLLSLALVCFISAPVFSGDDPWDVDGSSGNGSGNDGDIIIPPPGDSITLDGTRTDGNGFGSDWLTGITYRISYQIITYFLGLEEKSGKVRVVVEESSGNVTAH